MLQIDYLSHINDIIKKIQDLDVPEGYKLSDNRSKLILKILKERREKLRELL